MHLIRIKAYHWPHELLARRLWHLLLGDDRTPEDQRIWLNQRGNDASWTLSNGGWFFSLVQENRENGLAIYELRHRYGFEPAQMQALAACLVMLLGVEEAEALET